MFFKIIISFIFVKPIRTLKTFLKIHCKRKI